jgi:branched-chain amino acid transport system permease protein
VVVGGLGSLPGALFGSAILVFLPPAVVTLGGDLGLDGTRSAQLAPLVYGVVLVLVILLAPSGVAGLIRKLTSRRTK